MSTAKAYTRFALHTALISERSFYPKTVCLFLAAKTNVLPLIHQKKKKRDGEFEEISTTRRWIAVKLMRFHRRKSWWKRWPSRTKMHEVSARAIVRRYFTLAFLSFGGQGPVNQMCILLWKRKQEQEGESFPEVLSAQLFARSKVRLAILVDKSKNVLDDLRNGEEKKDIWKGKWFQWRRKPLKAFLERRLTD